MPSQGCPVPRFSLLIAVLAVAATMAALPGAASAVVLASEDFEAEGGGVGFLAGDTWGNLANGMSDTSVATPAFRAFNSPLNAPGLASGSVYFAFDFYTSSAAAWGGVALFEGVDGGDETVFIGKANGFPNYSIDLKGQGVLDSGVPVDDQVHRIIAELEFGTNDIYRMWVDNRNQAVPNEEVTLEGFIVDDPWQSLRVASGAPDNIIRVDNLVIADSPADVGLQTSFDATVTIDRSTGEVTLSSAGGVSGVVGYSLRSNAGSFSQSGWLTIDGRDADGDASVDANDDWTVLTDPGSTQDLSEFTFDVTGDGLALGATPISLGTAWTSTPLEDVFATITVDDNGQEVPLAVEVVYTGAAAVSGDLDGDNDIDLDDWSLFKAGQGAVNNTLTAVQAYQLGDLDGNFQRNLADYDLFAEAFDLANGAGAFQAAISGVPEPASIVMLLAGAAVVVARGRRAVAMIPVLMLAGFLFGAAPRAEATIFVQDDFSAADSGTGWAAGDVWEGWDSSGVVATHPEGGAAVASGRQFASPIDATNQLTYIRFDYRQQEGTGAAWGGFAFFEGPDINGDESFFGGANSGADDVNSYSFDLKNGMDLDSGVAFDAQFHTIIGAIDTTGDDTIYSIWVDSFDVGAPTATTTITGQGPIDAPWQSLRFQSGGNHEFGDNLLITDGAEEALVFTAPTPETLGLQVNKSTGAVSITNGTGANININAYSISSASGALGVGGSGGDFNADGSVDAADYTVWRDNLGEDAGVLNGNGSGAATVTQADYDLWRANYGGESGGSGEWNSIAGRDTPVAGFPQGSGDGLGWEEGGNPNSFQIEEYYLLGESAVTDSSIALGNIYGGGADGPQDLAFEYRSGEEVVLGKVTYVSGAPSAAASAPEPAALLLLVLGASGVLAKRR
ncbi:PEP-CTERM motif protein [Posidoniimonas corsicana]|uniref:PEP-CTERM motif protein n=1 Tax=Posidoniimonas corsicana TaxID=1938618 RepID=A0A5C5V5V0_9BACT|nr:PEP-CTERM sorting domain-containing protein [Posidoniimonas corsicana]TWT33916.1 PEP-CTERM motif protein [Posidoniimonas corsicana]